MIRFDEESLKSIVSEDVLTNEIMNTGMPWHSLNQKPERSSDRNFIMS